MKMPVLLSGHTMTQEARLRPQSLQINLRADGLSTASMVLDSESPNVDIGRWVQIWAPNGETVVMYVKNRKKDYVTGNITLSLEHTFGLLAGMVVFGEVTAATMAGSQSATTCTVYQAISYLLGQQTETLWAMAQADCDFNDQQGWKFTNSDIYSDLNSLTDAIMDCQWEFDQTTLPWALKLKAFPVASSMEMRRNRNLDTMSITLDRSGMYTRVYPTGKNNLHIDSVNSNVPYLDNNTATYGVIANVITDSTIASADLLKAWAQKQLAKNSVPKVTVSISGYELSQATGESWDKLIVGRMCRVPLPEYPEFSTAPVTERLVELSWKDALNQPEAVTCTLANELKTITGVLNEKARGGGGGSKKNNTEHDCELQEDEEKITEFENSDIWINRDSIWAVCGSYTVTEWTDEHGVHHKKLKMNEGTALLMERDGTEWGIYDEGNLTGGICIQKINDNQDTSLKISADQIILDGAAVADSLDSQSIAVYGLDCSVGDISVFGCDNSFTFSGSSFSFSGNSLTMQTASITHATGFSSSHYFMYGNSTAGDYTITGKANGKVATGSTTTTLHYLGY